MRLWSKTFLMAGLIALMAGCQSPLASLPSEDQHPELVALKAQGAKVKRRTSNVPVEITPGHVIHVAVHEAGTLRHGRTLVLVHGVMSDSKIWRFVDAQWARDYRVLAIDLNVPCLIVWGEEDETLSAGMGHMLRDDLPRARLRIVTHARHSLPTERPRVCAKLVSEFLAAAPGPDAAPAPVSRIDGLTGLEEPSSVLGLSR